MFTSQLRLKANTAKRHHCGQAMINIAPAASPKNTTLDQPDTKTAKTKHGGLAGSEDRFYSSGHGYDFAGLVLVAGDLWIRGVRVWWDGHSLTGSVVSSLLVLAVSYWIALQHFHDSFKMVIETIGSFGLLLFGICALFTWGVDRQKNADA